MELRISLAILFGLSALAVVTHVSIMLAGFALGLALAAIGEPRRLARQLFGITEGFFGPLFFVWLGASLQVRDLGAHPWLILLGVALGAGAIVAHAAGSLLKQPLALAILSTAQLGVPVAAATIGTETHLLRPGEPAALMFGALLTITATSVAGTIAARVKSTAPEPDPHGGESKPAGLPLCDDLEGDSGRNLGMQPHYERVAADGLDVRAGHLHRALVHVGAAGLLDRRHDVCRTDRAEQLPGVARGAGRQQPCRDPRSRS